MPIFVDAPPAGAAAKAVSKSAAKIDGKCAIPAANPACYAPANDTGAEWADLTRYTVEFEVPLVFCGSPGGAFLD